MMTPPAETTFSRYQDGADFFVLSAPSSQDILTDAKFISWVNGIEFPDAKFIVNHDIFHFAFEQGWLHERYQALTGQSLERFSSYAFHGEAIIELSSRFFGNLQPLPLIVGPEHPDIPAGEYLALPKAQPGLRLNKPELIFPVFFTPLNAGQFTVDFDEQSAGFLELKRMTIIASLVTGQLVDDFIAYLQTTGHDQPEWSDYHFFHGADFQAMVDAFVRDSAQELPVLLRELDGFLQANYGTSLSKSLTYYDLCLQIFYTAFLHPASDRIFQSEDSYLFPTQDTRGKPTLMADLFFLNRSANAVYWTKFGSLSVKAGVDAKTKQTIEKICRALTLVEGDLSTQRVLKFKVNSGAMAADETVTDPAARLDFLHNYLKNIPESTKALIANHTERFFGFCCLDSPQDTTA